MADVKKPTAEQIAKANEILMKEGKYRPRATVSFEFNGTDRHHKKGETADVQERQAEAFAALGYGTIKKGK